MIGVLIVTHGALAEELLSAAGRVAGCPPREMRALALDWTVGLEEARRRICGAIEALDTGSGVLVLTDMYGATPSNAALSCRRPGHVELIAGVNLPMVVRLACTSREEQSLAQVARWLEVKGRRSIRRADAAEGDGGAAGEQEGD